MDAIGTSLEVAGAGNVTLKTTSGYTGETVTNTKTGGTLTVQSAAATAQDSSNIAADLLKFTGNVNGALTFKTGANAELTGATTTLATITASTAASESVNLKASGAAITTLGAAANLETLNLTAAATAVTGTDLTVSNTVLNSNKIVVSGTNDVSLANVTNAGTIDASALVGNLTLGQTGTGSILNITGSATGTNAITFTATTVASNYVGGAGNDTVIFAQTAGAGVASATAVVGNGANSVTANALTTGDLVVIGGTGVDTISATALTAGNVNLNLSDGNNVVTLGGTLAGATIVVTTGAGTDNVTLTSATHANDKVTLTLGDGTDTLNISTDDSAGTFTVSGLDVIAIGSSDTAAKVNATLLTGQTYKITGDGTATDHLKVLFSAAGTGNFSGLVIDNTLSTGLAGLDILGTSGNQTIVGTAGADIIDGNDGTDFITGGIGVDTITAGTGVDTFVYAAGDSGATATTADQITDFTSTADKFSFGIAAGSVTNYGEDTASDADMATGKAAADVAMNGTVRYFFTDDSTDGYLFVDMDGDGTADLGIILLGVTDMALGDIIA